MSTTWASAWATAWVRDDPAMIQATSRRWVSYGDKMSALRPVGPVQSLQIGVVGDQLDVAFTDLAPFRGPGPALIGLQPFHHQNHEDQERGKLHEGPCDPAAGGLVYQ